MSASAPPPQPTAESPAAPHRAPPCGARTRAGSPCLGLAMANGRCRLHGGASTGPRTAAGLARMIAAKTTHGRYAMSGAAQRTAQRYFRALVVRTRLLCMAHRLRPYLPAEAAARLETAPAELKAPKHPSQVAWEALHATTPCTCPPPQLGAGRRRRAARTRLGADGPAAGGAGGEAGGGAAGGAAAAARRGRAAERAAARVEAAAQAQWRAAIAAARGAKRAAREVRRARRAVRATTPCKARRCGTGRAVRATTPCTVRRRGGARAAAPAGHQAGGAVGWAPGSPGLAEALAREVMVRQLRAALASCGNDPMQGAGAGRQSGTPRNNPMQGAARGGSGEARVGSARALVLGGTPLARTWQPRVAKVLAARFGPAAMAGWPGALAPPAGIAAMPSGDCAQRPYAGAATAGAVRGGGAGGSSRRSSGPGSNGFAGCTKASRGCRPSPA